MNKFLYNLGVDKTSLTAIQNPEVVKKNNDKFDNVQ